MRGWLSLLTTESDLGRYRTGVFVASAEPEIIAKSLPSLLARFPQVAFTFLVPGAYAGPFTWPGEVVWIEELKTNPRQWAINLRKRNFDLCIVLFAKRPTFLRTKLAALFLNARRTIAVDEEGNSLLFDREHWRPVITSVLAAARFLRTPGLTDIRGPRPPQRIAQGNTIVVESPVPADNKVDSKKESPMADAGSPDSKCVFDAEYAARVEQEKTLYTALHRESNEDLTERGNPALNYVLGKVLEKVRSQIGLTVWDYVVKVVNQRPGCQILSLGSGPCGVEINLARHFTVDYLFHCMDINPHLLAQGEERSKKLGLKFRFSAQDINHLALDACSCDVVFAHAALHHFLALEHIFSEVRRALKPNGLFIAYEVIPRNGMLMWQETNEVAQKIWRQLPERFKYDQTASRRFYTAELPNQELGVKSFECIRSQDIYALLKSMFHTEIEVPALAFTRRFVDNQFGPNYDLQREEDRALVDLILDLDELYLEFGKLKPEAIFMVMS
jgi:ubiquinone/menaquinone biosynthesis C-methylase UbiE